MWVPKKPPEQQLNDDQSVKIEIEGLVAVYGPERVTYRAEERTLSVLHLTPSDHPQPEGEADNAPHRFSVDFLLPPAYPSEEPPRCYVSAGWLNDKETSDLEAIPPELFVKNEPVLWDLLELIRERIPPFCRPASKEEPEAGVLHQNEEDLTGDIFWEHRNEASQGVSFPHITICHGDTIVDRKSIFQAHVARVHSYAEVAFVRDVLMSNHKIARAAHNILAYRFFVPNDKKTDGSRRVEPASAADSPAQGKGGGKKMKSKHHQAGGASASGGTPPDMLLIQDHDSDGEDAAGGRLQHLLQLLHVKNVVVVVTRWYGGIHLGPDRFKHINNAARQALSQFDFIPCEITKK